jgi:hypothetical protein
MCEQLHRNPRLLTVGIDRRTDDDEAINPERSELAKAAHAMVRRTNYPEPVDELVGKPGCLWRPRPGVMTHVVRLVDLVQDTLGCLVYWSGDSAVHGGESGERRETAGANAASDRDVGMRDHVDERTDALSTCRTSDIGGICHPLWVGSYGEQRTVGVLAGNGEGLRPSRDDLDGHARQISRQPVELTVGWPVREP